MINAIVCVDNNWGIGKKNGLLFDIKADMKHFREMTKNKVVLMGENTLLSFPGSKPLKNRVNVDLCPEGHEYEDCICLHSFEAMLNFAQIMAKEYDIFVIGGGCFYMSMCPYYDRVYVTHVDAVDPEATVFFPDLNKAGFKVTAETSVQEEGEYNFRMVTYEKGV